MKPQRTGAPAVALVVREAACHQELVAALSRHYDLLLTQRWEELAALSGFGSRLALADLAALAAWTGAESPPGRAAELRIMALVHRHELSQAGPSLLQRVDDFIVAPICEGELLLRVARLLSACPCGADECRAGPFRVHLRTGEAYRGAVRLSLTPKEVALLFALVRRAGRTVPRDDLFLEVWGPDADSSSNVLDACIRSLRRKVEPEPGRPRYIQTVRGIGYRLHVGPAAEGLSPAGGPASPRGSGDGV